MEEQKIEQRRINLRVYDRDMGVNVNVEDEIYYREAAKLITETINSYANVYQNKKSKEDLLYMTLLDIALRYEQDTQRSDKQSFEQMLNKLTSQIEESLSEK